MFLLAAALLMQPATDPPVDWDKEFGVEEKVRDPVTSISIEKANRLR